MTDTIACSFDDIQDRFKDIETSNQSLDSLVAHELHWLKQDKDLATCLTNTYPLSSALQSVNIKTQFAFSEQAGVLLTYILKTHSYDDTMNCSDHFIVDDLKQNRSLFVLRVGDYPPVCILQEEEKEEKRQERLQNFIKAFSSDPAVIEANSAYLPATRKP